MSFSFEEEAYSRVCLCCNDHECRDVFYQYILVEYRPKQKQIDYAIAKGHKVPVAETYYEKFPLCKSCHDVFRQEEYEQTVMYLHSEEHPIVIGNDIMDFNDCVCEIVKEGLAKQYGCCVDHEHNNGVSFKHILVESRPKQKHIDHAIANGYDVPIVETYRDQFPMCTPCYKVFKQQQVPIVVGYDRYDHEDAISETVRQALKNMV